MRIHVVSSAILACSMLAGSAFAQTVTPRDTNTAPAATAANPAPVSHTGMWRASKLIGVNVYNEQNEKLGDINEVLMDHSGKVAGVVVGVGGFLGMGEHDVLVSLDKIKFVNEPVRTSTTNARPATTVGSATTARNANEKWYPDHAVMSATKEQLKSMQQFKYSSYN